MTSVIDHPALRLPNDPEILQESIIQIARQIDGELPYYLMAAFGINKAEAKMLHCLFLTQQGLSNSATYQKMTSSLRPESFNIYLSHLRRKLAGFQIVIPCNSKGTEQVKIAEGKPKVEAVIDNYKKAKQEICATLKVSSLQFSSEYLPHNKSDLQTMLNALLVFVRSNPVQNPIAEISVNPSLRIILGAFHASIERNESFVITERIKPALFPPFVEVEVENLENLCHKHVSKLHKYFEPSRSRSVSNGIVLIPSQIRQLFAAEAPSP